MGCVPGGARALQELLLPRSLRQRGRKEKPILSLSPVLFFLAHASHLLNPARNQVTVEAQENILLLLYLLSTIAWQFAQIRTSQNHIV